MRRNLRKRFGAIDVWWGPSDTPYTEEAEKRNKNEKEPKKYEWFSKLR